jgi:CHAD domain-containing protein
LKKSSKLAQMGTTKRHRLRLANKRLRYAIEFFAALLANNGSTVRDTLKQLRKAQAALGELNDGSQGETLAASLPRHTASPAKTRFLDRKREKQLVRATGRAYRKLAELEPLRT